MHELLIIYKQTKLWQDSEEHEAKICSYEILNKGLDNDLSEKYYTDDKMQKKKKWKSDTTIQGIRGHFYFFNNWQRCCSLN